MIDTIVHTSFAIVAILFCVLCCVGLIALILMMLSGTIEAVLDWIIKIKQKYRNL